MKKIYMIGNHEKHRLEIKTNWLLGMMVLKLDDKILARRSFFLKMDMSFEVGDKEKHLLTFKFNLFDYWQDIMHVKLDGAPMPEDRELDGGEARADTPIDDAAAAFFFMVLMNVIFSVIGTLFVPDLDSLQVRLVLLAGAFIYLLFGMQTLRYHHQGLITGALFYLADSVVFMIYQFSWGGLCVRGIIAYYLFCGFHFWNKARLSRSKRLRAQIAL